MLRIRQTRPDSFRFTGRNHTDFQAEGGLRRQVSGVSLIAIEAVRYSVTHLGSRHFSPTHEEPITACFHSYFAPGA